MSWAVVLGAGGVLNLIVCVWVLVLILRRPAWAWERADRNRAFWIGALLFGLLVPFVGLMVGLWVLLSVDARVRKMEQLGPRIGFPGR